MPYNAWNIDQEELIKYLNKTIHILAKFSWIYNIKNTEVFVHDVLEKIPNDWCISLAELSTEDICRIPFGFIKNDWPTSLQEFLSESLHQASFRFPTATLKDFQEYLPEHRVKFKKTSLKKQFEVEIMSGLVHTVCSKNDCSVVLDIGSGLGYLDQVLHHNFGLFTIGLDSNSKFTCTAQERLEDDQCRHSMLHTTSKVEYSTKCHQNLNSIFKMKKYFKCNCKFKSKLESLGNQSLVMIGLHSCGNLAQDMMRLFCDIEELTAFVCVGCCFNKINLEEFPMSSAAKLSVSLTCELFLEWQPCVSGLRLASHGTRAHPSSLPNDSGCIKAICYRALLQLYINRENISWQQPKRHIRETDLLNFTTYCNSMLKNHPLGKNEKVIKDLSDIHDQKQYLFPRIRILLILQSVLQPLWEGFIAVDRMLYFKERSFLTEIIALWDDSKSSRNLAVCAYKS